MSRHLGEMPPPPERPGQGPQSGAGYVSPTHPPHIAPPPRKRRVWPWVVGGLAVLFIAGFAGCAALIGGAASSISAASGPKSFVYVLEGDGEAQVTYSRDVGSTASEQVTLPWRTEVQFRDGLTAVPTLTASTISGEPITCQILDQAGAEVAKSQAQGGQAAAVSCMPPPAGVLSPVPVSPQTN